MLPVYSASHPRLFFSDSNRERRLDGKAARAAKDGTFRGEVDTKAA
jgi:hypothetical protein